VLERLAEVISEDETGIVATAELADRIGRDAKSLGEALHRLGIASPYSPRQRVGSKHPVSVHDVNAIAAAIGSYSDDE
jgi:DNA segregation ATPase FtsK/SpoIIIE, S-DNA-T family